MLGFSQLGALALGEMPPAAVADTYRVECNGTSVVGFVGSAAAAGSITVLAQATRNLVGSANAKSDTTITGLATTSFVGSAKGLGAIAISGTGTPDFIGLSIGPANFTSTDAAIVLWRHLPIPFAAGAAASTSFTSSTRNEIVIHTQGVLSPTSEIIL